MPEDKKNIWKEIRDWAAPYVIKAGIFANAVFGIGATPGPSEAVSLKDAVKKSEIKAAVPEKKDADKTNYSFYGQEKIPGSCVNVQALTDYLCQQDITMADILASGALSREDLSTIQYSADDIKQMGGSSLIDKTITYLERHAKPKSTSLCLTSVREGWFKATSAEKRSLQDKFKGKFGLSQENKKIAPENIYCMTERGHAKDWPAAVKEHSNLLVSIGTAKQDGSGNIDFTALEASNGMINVVPGKGSEPGHAFVSKQGKQYSDFCGDDEWIYRKMQQGEYLPQVEFLVPLDSKPCPKLVEMMVKRLQERQDAQNLCACFGVKPGRFLDEGKMFANVFGNSFSDMKLSSVTEKLAHKKVSEEKPETVQAPKAPVKQNISSRLLAQNSPRSGVRR